MEPRRSNGNRLHLGLPSPSETFYTWSRPLARAMLTAQPNPAHQALAHLEHLGVLKTLITQNVDSLHQQAGTQSIIELHGHIRTAHCTRCEFRTVALPYLQALVEEDTLPICTQCGSTLKPDVILFGEPLPHKAIIKAQEEASQCDLILIVGSSLEIMPAADLPALAARSNARLIIANIEPTPFDHLADVILRGDVVDTIPQLVEQHEQGEC